MAKGASGGRPLKGKGPGKGPGFAKGQGFGKGPGFGKGSGFGKGPGGPPRDRRDRDDDRPPFQARRDRDEDGAPFRARRERDDVGPPFRRDRDDVGRPPFRGGADRGGADRGGADRGGADRGGPDRGAPGRGFAQRAAPGRGAPGRGAPARGAPDRGRRDDRDERPAPFRRSGPVGDLLYGRNAVLEALRAGREIRRVMVATGAHGEAITEIVDTARAKKITVQSVDRRRLDDMALHHQGVVAEAAPYKYASLDQIVEATKATAAPPLVLVLDVLQDPQNFGSLLRTAAAAGAQGVVIPEHRAVGVTPAVVKASAGAIERLLIAQVVNLSRAIDELKQAGLWAVGLDPRADERYDKADLDRPLALVVGGEGKGLRPLVRDHCDIVVSLPMPGGIESLNAAVAGSIVLYEVLRQRAR